MNYRVVWRRRAESQLAALWLRAANKDAVAGYAEQVERILQRNPADQGESRAGNVRIWFHRPISVLYEIDEGDKRVTVMAIKWVGR
jgi:plasmid stabilization system protein ParE